jgi:lysophospholipase L1-like esterase
MKRFVLRFFVLFSITTILSCEDKTADEPGFVEDEVIKTKTINLMSLGDSHTKGTGICETCAYPQQLTQTIKNLSPAESAIKLEVVARTGWTTSDLILQLNNLEIDPKYDLVTLLIGVNNQYQNGSFSLYEQEFPELVNKAIQFAKGNRDKVIVISIPDYAFTPFGQNWVPDPQVISDEIDAYNSFAKAYSEDNGVSFVDITDISREGLDNPDLVADDDLHLSRLAHSRITERLFPLALTKI